jgi:hypothetical protein
MTLSRHSKEQELDGTDFPRNTTHVGCASFRDLDFLHELPDVVGCSHRGICMPWFDWVFGFLFDMALSRLFRPLNGARCIDW